SHGLGFDLLDAAAGADRLVVEADAGLLLVSVGPLCVDRIGEGGAGAGNVGGMGGGKGEGRRGGHRNRNGRRAEDMSHWACSCSDLVSAASFSDARERP